MIPAGIPIFGNPQAPENSDFFHVPDCADGALVINVVFGDPRYR